MSAMPAAVLERVPELAAFARTATVLKPRPGETVMTGSHVGGPLLWPAGEEWPTCRDKREVTDPDGFNGRWRKHSAPNPLLAVAQLRVEDAPDLPCPPGKDLLQLLWCPAFHKGPPFGPAVEVRWRRAADVVEPLVEQPESEIGTTWFEPRPCVFVAAERVTEYPWSEELPPALRAAVEQVDDDYNRHAISSGWKAGGYAKFGVTGFFEIDCGRCGTRKRLALVVDSGDDTGLIVGRHGELRVFVCPSCPEAWDSIDIQ